MAGLVLTHLTKVYPVSNHGVNDVTLDVPDGCLLALVGPSGCGKTTLLRLIAGLEAATSGSVALGGRLLEGVAPRDRNVAMVFQGHALYPHLDVFGNLAFPLLLRKSARDAVEQRVRQTAAMLGIEQLLHRKPRSLSGGEQQRVALGRAMVRRPACFLMDEPLSGLDARLRDEVRAELKGIHQRLGATMVFVTHDQQEAMTLGDRIAVMHAGAILQVGTPYEVYRHPSDGFVAGFLGSPPMNFLHGSLAVEEERWWFVHSGHRLAVPRWARAELAGHLGKPLILGIRPEAMVEAPIGSQEDNRLMGIVDLVDFVGNRLLVQGSTNGSTLIAQLDASATAVVGQRKVWAIDLDYVHFFAPPQEQGGAPGANLCPRGEQSIPGVKA